MRLVGKSQYNSNPAVKHCSAAPRKPSSLTHCSIARRKPAGNMPLTTGTAAGNTDSSACDSPRSAAPPHD
ncbi:MAG UNVERIFIED_CONTAM: hypothetical protein LVR18_47260 [Planctomycetaceae bacterium]